MGKIVCAIALLVGLMTALEWSLSLPTVIKSTSGEIICVLDSNGKKIPIEHVSDRYHLEYAQVCPHLF